MPQEKVSSDEEHFASLASEDDDLVDTMSGGDTLSCGVRALL